MTSFDISIVMQFALATVLPAIASVVLVVLDKRTRLGSLPYWPRQVLIGVVFGAIAIFGTEFGIITHDATMNVRDAAPIAAALYFGGPAGIIAGIIGGIERWFAALWGRGMFTRVACSLATAASGFYAALLRKYVFDGRKPSWLLAFFTGMVAEVLHLMLVFVTNVDNIPTAFVVVRACSIPMVTCTGIAAALAGAAVALMEGRSLLHRKESRDVSQTIQLGMLSVVVVAFSITLAFTMTMQWSLAYDNAHSLLLRDLNDTATYITTTDKYGSPHADRIAKEVAHNHVGQSGRIMAFDESGTFVGTLANVEVSTQEAEQFAQDVGAYEPDELFSAEFEGVGYLCSYQDVDGYRLLAMIPTEEANFSREFAVLITADMEVLVLAALFAAIFILVANVVVRNIHRINARLNEIASGNLDVVVDVRSSTEFSSLSDDINTTVSALRDLIAAEGARIERDLNTAAAIQRSALPRTFPPFPQIPKFDIYASMNTAREVGGDFYDFFLMDDTRLGLMVADVSDKGIPAALFMMAAKTSLSNYMQSGMELGEAVRTANWHLCQNNDTQMFVTAWVATLDYETGELTYVNAGHNPPLLRHDGKWEWLRQRSGPMMGAFDIAMYRQETITLEPGDELYIYTDGVTEAFDANDEEYGEERLAEFLARTNGEHPRSLIEAMRGELKAWTKGTEQSDDITMLALEYGVPPEIANTITVPASKDGLAEGMDFVNQELGQRFCPIEVQKEIDTLYARLFKEAMSGGGAKRVQVQYVFTTDPNALVTSLTYEGVEHDPIAVLGGRDYDVSYVRDKRQNVVAFRQEW